MVSVDGPPATYQAGDVLLPPPSAGRGTRGPEPDVDQGLGGATETHLNGVDGISRPNGEPYGLASFRDLRGWPAPIVHLAKDLLGGGTQHGRADLSSRVPC